MYGRMGSGIDYRFGHIGRRVRWKITPVFPELFEHRCECSPRSYKIDSNVIGHLAPQGPHESKNLELEGETEQIGKGSMTYAVLGCSV